MFCVHDDQISGSLSEMQSLEGLIPNTDRDVTARGARTRDHKVKGLALYRLS